MGKYHLTSQTNNICQQQHYIAIPPENTDFSHKYLLSFSWFISRSSVSVANRLFQNPRPGSPFLFQHTRIFLVWKTLTASKENIAPLPVHPDFGNLEFKFQFWDFFSPKAVFLADREVLDKLISWKQFIAVTWAIPFPSLYYAYSAASGKLLKNN